MKWILDLSTRTKLFFSFGLILFFLVVALFIAYAGIMIIRDAQRTLYEQDFTLALMLKDVRANQNATRANALAGRSTTGKTGRCGPASTPGPLNRAAWRMCG